MKQVRLKLGDVFSVALDPQCVKYFQYVADDTSQLNSAVIRIFKEKYRNNVVSDLDQIVDGEVDFYAHVFLRNGVKFGYWSKIGNKMPVETPKVLFRDSNDYGNPTVKVSSNWYLWRINEPHVRVGKLKGEARNAEIGIVVAPPGIITRMKTGKYDFVYPAYE